MSEGEDKARMLNELFKSLGEVGEESQQWKEYHESWIKLFHQLFEFMANRTDINTRLYGSSAENLKNYSFDDVGDLDVLLFPGDCIVDENMLEYLPKDPAYVKIKGTEHPLLQSILAEDTEYVSASDIKALHPAVLMLFPRVVEAIITHFSLPASVDCSVRERDANSPAFTLAFQSTLSRDVVSRGLEQLKQLNFQNLDPSELEYFPVTLCAIADVEYTPRHAEAFDDFVHHAKDSLKSLCSNPRGIIQGIPEFVQEIWSSEKAKEIRNRFCNAERDSKNESGSKPENNSLDENENNSPKCKQLDKLMSSPDFAEKVNLEEAMANEGTEGCVGGKNITINSHSTSKAQIQGHELVAPTEIPQVAQLPDIRQDQEDGFFSQAFKYLSEDGKQALFDWLVKEKADDVFDFLGTVESVKELQSLYSDESQKCIQSMSIDLVPALQARGWPKVAREWLNRKRQWPTPATIHRIIQEGFHLVVKPPKGSDCPEDYFRLSFSNAEYLLSQELNDIQRHCYRGLKKYYSVYLRTEPKCLVTYHLKTIFLQTCEETAAEMWTEENITACMMELLANLHNALTKKHLRHFFITPCNLFDIEYIKTPQVLDSLAVKVEQFMTNPMKFSQELIPAQETRRSDVVTSRTNEEEQEEVEASIEGTLPRGDPKCGQLAAKYEENEGSSSQEESTRKMAGIVKEAITMHGSQGTATDTSQGARFHDLKDLYDQTCRELLTIAVEDRSIDELDSIERSLVEDIKELTREYKLHPEKLLELFKALWQATFIRMFFGSEFYTKQSMLDAMKNNMKLIKHIVLQDGFLGSPRDYSLIFPADSFVNLYRRSKRIMSSMEKPIAKIEDIPLD